MRTELVRGDATTSCASWRVMYKIWPLTFAGALFRLSEQILTSSFEVSKKNKVRQLREYARYEKETVFSILDAGLVAHVAVIQDGLPVVVPMIYGRDEETVYLHGARKARVIRMLEQTEVACINVTLIDGIVFARSVFNSSMNYRSVTLFGSPRLINGHDAKLEAMRTISEHTMPGRWAEVRDSHEREVKMTGVIAVNIETASAKVTSGDPTDEDEDYEIPIWAGVLPITMSTGSFEDDSRLMEGMTPSDTIRKLEGKTI